MWRVKDGIRCDPAAQATKTICFIPIFVVLVSLPREISLPAANISRGE